MTVLDLKSNVSNNFYFDVKINEITYGGIKLITVAPKLPPKVYFLYTSSFLLFQYTNLLVVVPYTIFDGSLVAIIFDVKSHKYL